MTVGELSLCLVAVFSSSTSQLCIKMASGTFQTFRGLLLLAISVFLMLFSVLILVWILRTIQLSQVIPFAAAAYILVPLGGQAFFNEHVPPRFWLGVASILVGVYLTVS